MNVEDFIIYLKTERRVSEHTVLAYQKDIEHFFDFMQHDLNVQTLEAITSDDVRTWIVSLIEDDKNSTRTVNRKLSSLKAYFRYQLKIGRLTNNPMNEVLAPKISKRLPVYVEQKDMEHLFSPELFEDTFEGKRDQMILELFYATGIRLSELLNLKREDVNMSQLTVKVLGKRNKERIIPFGEHLCELFTNYFDIYQKIILLSYIKNGRNFKYL